MYRYEKTIFITNITSINICKLLNRYYTDQRGEGVIKAYLINFFFIMAENHLYFNVKFLFFKVKREGFIMEITNNSAVCKNCEKEEQKKKVIAMGLTTLINTLYVVCDNLVAAKFIYSPGTGTFAGDEYYSLDNPNFENNPKLQFSSLGLRSDPDFEASEKIEFLGIPNALAHFQLYKDNAHPVVVVFFDEGSLITLYENLKLMNMSAAILNCANFSEKKKESLRKKRTSKNLASVITTVYVVNEEFVTAKYNYSKVGGYYESAEVFEKCILGMTQKSKLTFKSLKLKEDKRCVPGKTIVLKEENGDSRCAAHFRLYSEGSRKVIVAFLDGGNLNVLYDNLSRMDISMAILLCTNFV